MCCGILMVYSASMATAYSYYGTPYYFLDRELIWVGIGLVALAVAARTSYLRWAQAALPLFCLAMVLLILVMVPHVGHVSHGARRWLALSSSVALEPSEMVKLALVVYLAKWLAAKGNRVRDFQACFVPFNLVVGMIALLIVKQPDLGTAIVVTATAFAVYFVAGASLAHVGLVAAGASGFAWTLMHTAGYRHDRLTAFINPWNDPSGVGYHTIQALLALRYGGLFGRGLGNSTQKYVLPAPHTDSILSIIGEEWGLVGAIAVLLLFLVIAYRGMRITTAVPDQFGKLLAAGITSWITFQALMNFAVITSSVPFTGVPLPFVSYGGTSLVISMVGVGILLNISRHAGVEGFEYQTSDNGRRNRRARLPGVVRHQVSASVAVSPTGTGSGPRQPRLRGAERGSRSDGRRSRVLDR
jgi:cell division protein FtsW